MKGRKKEEMKRRNQKKGKNAAHNRGKQEKKIGKIECSDTS